VSRNGKAGPAPAGGWLEGDEQRAWLAYIRVQLRPAYEMNRQLLADSGMSLPDYDVLTALSVADGGPRDRIMTGCVRNPSVRQCHAEAPGRVLAGQRRAWDSNPRGMSPPLMVFKTIAIGH
jgi:hypothetical protein